MKIYKVEDLNDATVPVTFYEKKGEARKAQQTYKKNYHTKVEKEDVRLIPIELKGKSQIIQYLNDLISN